MTYMFTPQCRRPRTRAALPLALLAGLGHRSARGQCQDRHPAPLLTRDEQHFRRRSGAPGAPEHTVGSRRYVRQHRDRLRRQPRAARRHAQRLGPPALHDHEHQQHGSDGAFSGQIAIGGSMLLANDERFTLSASPPPTRINGGTGIHRHARGLLTPTSIGHNDPGQLLTLVTGGRVGRLLVMVPTPPSAGGTTWSPESNGTAPDAARADQAALAASSP